jgi:hypothetical protein
LPIFALTVPKICPHFWAPSPESETTSTVCRSVCRTFTVRARSSVAIDSGPSIGVFVGMLFSLYPLSRLVVLRGVQ